MPRLPNADLFRARYDQTFMRLLALLAAIFVVRLAILAVLPLHPDEAYYRLWAMKLAWGYLDHPPLIASWIRAGMEVVGDNSPGLRLTSVIASVATSLIVYAIAREFELEPRLAAAGAIWVQCEWGTIHAYYGGGLATPDAPAAFFWAATCACVARAARLNSVRWWVGAGILGGLACLSKYTAFFLAPGLLFWLLISPDDRVHLRRPGPWLAALAAIAVFAPHLAWNEANDWITFRKQFERVVPDGIDLLAPPIFLLDWSCVLGFGIFAAACFGAVKSLRTPRSEPRYRCGRFLAAVSAPLVVYMMIHALHSEIATYWPTPINPVLALLAVLGAEGMTRAWRDRYHFVVIGLAICAFLILGPAHYILRWHNLIGPEAWSVSIRWLAASALLLLLAVIVLLLAAANVGSRSRRKPRAAASVAALACVSVSAIFWLRIYAYPPEPVWRELAKVLRDRADMHGAEWIGAVSYETHALLHPDLSGDPGIAQLDERVRYPADRIFAVRDPGAPGLVVAGRDDAWSLRHRNDVAILDFLQSCFARVIPAGSVFRRGHVRRDEREYGTYLVSGATRDWLRRGCRMSSPRAPAIPGEGGWDPGDTG